MLQPDQQFAHFRILSKLGEGGMGVVYRAEDQKLGRQVALKVLPADFLADADRRERFLREARTAASINHPNVTAIYDLGEAEVEGLDQPVGYIVMELVEGRSLGAVMADGPLALDRAVRLAERIASGLDAAHRLQIVHRDIKPENVLLTEEDEPKILDFGLAKPLQTGFSMGADDATMAAELTQEGRVVGTVAYMSPEQAQGKSLDTRSDIFSFGILLYRMVTGLAPFEGETSVSVLAKIIEGAHRPAAEAYEGIPDDLNAIIDRCLEKDPGKRFQTTRDLVEQLRALRRQFESGVSAAFSTGGSGSAQRMSVAVPPTTRRWGIPLAITAALVAVAAVAFFMLRGGTGGTPVALAGEPALAVVPFENKTGDAELDWLATGLPDILLTDLSEASDLKLISRDQVGNAIRRDDMDEAPGSGDWIKASRSVGANRVLSGSYFKLGDRIRIDARILDAASGDVVFARKVVGDDAFAVVDSLTFLVAEGLNLGAMPAGGDMVESMTTSPEAYKHYHLGYEHFLVGRLEEAREEFARSIEIDSTFALPYLRTGMTYVFSNLSQRAQPYLAKAVELQDHLPPRNRALLDIYADTWLRNEFGEANTKLGAYVQAYPDDKEARSLHALFILSFAGDTTAAYAELEEVLTMDPDFPLALEFYASQLTAREEYARAAVLWDRYLEAHPDSPDALDSLGDLYRRMDEYDQAMEVYGRFAEAFPDDPRVYSDMSSVAVAQRRFDEAERYVERIRQMRPDDHQWLRTYAVLRANLSTWRGEFGSALEHYEEVVEQSMALADTNLVYGALNTYATYLARFDRKDQAIEVAERLRGWSPEVNRVGYPLMAVGLQPERGEELRPLMDQAIDSFRKFTPRELWSTTEMLSDLYEAFADEDTAAIIVVFRELLERPQQMGGSEHDLAEMLTTQGEYAEAVEIFRKQAPSANAYVHLSGCYWEGRALEGLGRTQEAAAKYREVLEYWGSADWEIEEITKARAGLARMTG